jgi:hypothetical protein
MGTELRERRFNEQKVALLSARVADAVQTGIRAAGKEP